MSEGDYTIFNSQGEQYPDMIQSDLLFYIHEREHSIFKRENNNLLTSMEISLEEALLGFEKSLQHLDGHEVVVRSSAKAIVQPFSKKILHGEGMPIRYSDAYGEMQVKMLVNFPKSLSQQQKQLIELIFPENDLSKLK